jgi:cellulose synthase (UDP-forming)
VFNFILTTIAWRAIGERQQRRASPRVEMDVAATVWVDGAPEVKVPARIIDASTSGIRVIFADGAERKLTDNVETLKGRTIVFQAAFPDTPHLEAPVRAVVMSARPGAGGMVCGTMLDPDQPISAQEAVAVLIFGDSEIWRRVRAGTSKPKGLIAGLFYALVLFATGLPRLLAMLVREPARRQDEALAGPRKAAPAHLLAFGVDIDARERLLSESRAAPVAPGAGG